MARPRGFSLSGRSNPPLTSTHHRSSTGETIAFLFRDNELQTPPLITRAHPDRSSDNPYPPRVRGIPVIVDAADEANLNEICEVKASVARLDPRIGEAISSSRKADVRGYYSDFYRHNRYPQPGFLLDARHASHGHVRRLQQHAPFFTSLGVEIAVPQYLSENEVEELGNTALSEVAIGPCSTHQPAYYRLAGYRIVQFGSEELALHVAPAHGVVSMSVRVDVKTEFSSLVEGSVEATPQLLQTASSTARPPCEGDGPLRKRP
jgi:hypothetical protein